MALEKHVGWTFRYVGWAPPLWSFYSCWWGFSGIVGPFLIRHRNKRKRSPECY